MSVTRKTNAAQIDSAAIIAPEAAQFRVFAMGEDKCRLAAYSRRDFFKVSLVLTGASRLLYADRDIEIAQPALIFTNPLVPYSWDEANMPQPTGYFCVFTDAFLAGGGRMESVQESTLFKSGGNPVYLLNDEQIAYLTGIFRRMHEDAASGYLYKLELARSQVQLLIHEAIKMQPAVAYYNPPNAASRIANLFLTLLGKQYPVESAQQPVLLRKAGDYAAQLAVHVNHLNAAVQEVTGKSTTTHINEKTLAEAKSLLRHTDWSVAEIAYSLGFEYASYFNNFFKKNTGFTPLQVRSGAAQEA